ncbi:MAG TPA: alpha/beta hydrolase [Rhodanobacteraceae bacterium]|jgi:pimeloyl-ACP methyl ester carboxylesterase|nr:alpha/beta hydrolase [Rhodanobacteraceae bacterium]
MTAVRELSLDLPHLRLAAQTWGDPLLPRLLALHGWLDNAASFDRLAPLLCEHFHIVALDLPGHGRSGHRPPGTWYHYVDYLGDALAAADALGWTRFGLLGHSLGGAVASMLAAACPQRIERLFLIEALGPLTAGVEQTLSLLQRAISQRHGLPAKALRVFASEAEAAQTRAKAGDLSLEAARIMVARGITPAPAGGFVWSSDPRLTLTSPQRYIEAQVLAVLDELHVPTQLILAQPAPSFLPEAMINARIARVRDLDVVRIAGHHHLHLDDPQPVAAAMLAFYAGR